MVFYAGNLQEIRCMLNTCMMSLCKCESPDFQKRRIIKRVYSIYSKLVPDNFPDDKRRSLVAKAIFQLVPSS